ncbi:MAG: MBL fold metallo-hydrolase [Halobacteriales archaeon]
MDVDRLSRDGGGSASNAYLVAGDRPTLVDVGTDPGVVSALRQRVDHLEAVVLTHDHWDHVDQLEAVVEAFAPRVYAFGAVEGRTDALEDGQSLVVGDAEVEVVHTPGHAPDHVALVGGSAAFTGDVVVYNDAAFDDGSFGRTDLPGADRETLIASLERVLTRLDADVSAMYPGHGEPFHGDVHAVVDRALERARRFEPKYPEEA